MVKIPKIIFEDRYFWGTSPRILNRRGGGRVPSVPPVATHIVSSQILRSTRVIVLSIVDNT